VHGFRGRYSGRDTVLPESDAGLSVITSLATSGTKVFVSQSESAESLVFLGGGTRRRGP